MQAVVRLERTGEYEAVTGHEGPWGPAIVDLDDVEGRRGALAALRDIGRGLNGPRPRFGGVGVKLGGVGAVALSAVLLLPIGAADTPAPTGSELATVDPEPDLDPRGTTTTTTAQPSPVAALALPLALSGGGTSPSSVPDDDADEPAPEPVIGPESEWIDGGNGVALPDVVLRIRFCESTNNYRATHPVSTASGAYQFLIGSWEWYGHADRYGVPEAYLATPAQQDEAILLTVERDGLRPWAASRHCWNDPDIDPRYRTAAPPATTTTIAPTTSSTEPSTSTSTSTSATSTTSPATTTTTTTTTDPTTTTTAAPTTSTTAASTSTSASSTSSSASTSTTLAG